MNSRAFGGILATAVCLGFVGCDDSGGSSFSNPIGWGDGGLVDPNGNPSGSGDSGSGPVIPGGGDNERPRQPEVPRECTPGMTRCLQEGAAEEERCRSDGTWGVAQCPADQTCLFGGCLRSAVNCQPGEQICLGDGRRATCSNQQWNPTTTCPDGLICSAGECSSEACAYAARSYSYVGCDYLAVDLPNRAYRDDLDESTPLAPLGIVLANNSATDTATVNILGRGGSPARLIGTMRLELSRRMQGQPHWERELAPQTLSSEVRDSDNMVIQTNIAAGANIEIPPGGIGTFLMPRQTGPHNETSLQNDAYRVVTDFPVVAYQFGPYCCNYSFSNDASLLLPTTALGTKYRYVGVPFWSTPDGGEIPVIAVLSPHNGNQVRVQLPPGVSALSDRRRRVRGGSGRIQVEMNAQDVLLLASDPRAGNSDLTGAVITSDEPVAVFSSHPCTYYPEEEYACDHLEEQLFPVSTWGNRFQLVPLAERNVSSPTEVTYWKFVADDQPLRIEFSLPFAQLNARAPGYPTVPNCQNFMQGPSTLALPAGGYCEFGTRVPVEVVSDQPFMVLGILVGQQATGLSADGRDGDPAVYLVPPDKQFRRDYTFLAPGTYFEDYVTVVTSAQNQIYLDGQLVPLDDATPIGGSNLSFKHIRIQDGAHSLQGNSPFGIIVYAFDEFVSYAFTGGLNLQKR